MKAKDRQLVRAIESEEQKRALAHHKFADAEKVRKQQLHEKQTQLKQANVAVTASNNMHMLLVSQAQLKKNVELKMAGDMDEVRPRPWSWHDLQCSHDSSVFMMCAAVVLCFLCFVFVLFFYFRFRSC